MYYRRRRNREHDRVIFSFDAFDITKHELILSIGIVVVLMIIGLLISAKISAYDDDQNAIYYTALKTDQSDIFDYGMRTDVGNAFVYGDLNAVDTVSYPEIDGDYIYLEKVKERYTMHTRTVTQTVNGKTTTRVETYWTWDAVGREYQQAEKIEFCGVIFPIEKLQLPSEEYIQTIKESGSIRYKYYGVGTHYTGTIFADLRDETIPDQTKFYNNSTIDETVEQLTARYGVLIFWIAWVILIALITFAFYYIDNQWLD